MSSSIRASGASVWLVYGVGVIVALMLALMLGALTARDAFAETLTVDRKDDPDYQVIGSQCTAAANDCSLRGAAIHSFGNGASDTINFASGMSGTISLTYPDPLLIPNDSAAAKDLVINGPGARVLSVSRSNFLLRVFDIAPGANATISGLTIKNGRTSNDDPNGGGIKNDGTLTLNRVTVSGNYASAGGFGGGIFNNGTLTITNSTFSGNKAETSDGGAIQNNDGKTLTVTNSTFSNNSANATYGRGGAINNRGTLTVTNSTISGNSANYGGGIRNAATLRNTIIAGNTAASGTAPDVIGTINSQGNNLIGNISGSTGWLDSDLLNRNPLLGPLQNNGGPTDTRAIWPGSPAIDRAANIGCPAVDQRGVLRKDGDGNGSVVCDIGAYERSDFSSPKVSSTTPAAGATGVRRGVTLSATFSEKMTRSTLNASTFKLFKVNSNGSTTQITNVVVSLSADGLKATLNPFGTSSTLLGANTRYRAVVTTGARDLAGNQLDQSPTVAGKQQKVWSFKTGG